MGLTWVWRPSVQRGEKVSASWRAEGPGTESAKEPSSWVTSLLCGVLITERVRGGTLYSLQGEMERNDRIPRTRLAFWHRIENETGKMAIPTEGLRYKNIHNRD